MPRRPSAAPDSKRRCGRARSRYGLFATPFGHLLAARSPQGLVWAALGDDPAGLEAAFARAFPADARTRDDRALHEVRAGLLATLSGAPYPGALDLRGTAFQQRVWAVLRSLRSGETATYAEIAARAGLPATAARVVAQAVAANPVALAVPCHRVVRGDARATEFPLGRGAQNGPARLRAAGAAVPLRPRAGGLAPGGQRRRARRSENTPMPAPATPSAIPARVSRRRMRGRSVGSPERRYWSNRSSASNL